MAEIPDMKWNSHTGAVAIKMAPNVTAYTWFVLAPAQGGHPSNDAEVVDWLDMNGQVDL